MVDFSKEIIFRDGITLDNGVDEMTEEFLEIVGRICDLGRNFGLTLDRFVIDSEMVRFEWRGRKDAMLRFYTYYSENMTTESLESREDAIRTILNK